MIYKLVLTSILVAVLWFSVFGFMETYELLTTVSRIALGAIYAAAAAWSIAGLVFVWKPAKKNKEEAPVVVLEDAPKD